MEIKKIHFFFYGTLMKGQTNHDLVPETNCDFVATGKLEGYKMYLIPAQNYNYLAIKKADKNSYVYGEVYEIPLNQIHMFDFIQGYNPLNIKESLYKREQVIINLSTGKKKICQCYVFNLDLPTNSKEIKGGKWN